MGQVWTKATFDGGNTSSPGGRGSVIAVTAQNPGRDGRWDTEDDVLAPLNETEQWPSHDASPRPNPEDRRDSIRNFASAHVGGAVFGFADGHVMFIANSVDSKVYRHLSTMRGEERIDAHEVN